MKSAPIRVFVVALAAATFGCSDDPVDPGPDVNPALAEAANSAGIGQSVGSDLPQGAAPFTGPNGIAMEATAEEFIQAVTIDGTLLRTSGVSVFAVPANGAGAPFDRVSFGAARTGALTSVGPGTYAFTAWPDIDFINEIMVYHAQVRLPGQRTGIVVTEGDVTIESIDYFPDVYTCSLIGNVFDVERCDYQLGVLRGSVEFRVADGSGGEFVQPRTSFTLPIRRRTIVATHVGL